MAALGNKVQNALDETRMLVLGAQVLLGFQFQATMQPGFERLPAEVQVLKVIGLTLMLVAVGLLISPGAYHQIVEAGNDSTHVIDFTTRIAAIALGPFAIGIGIDLYTASRSVLGDTLALATALGGGAFAIFFWYGLEWLVRARLHIVHRKDDPVTEHTPLADRIRQVLTEARVVLPGVQALLGFQFAAFLMDAFTKLPKTSQVLHLVALSLIAASIVFLMAPAAFHRLVEGGEDTERMHRFASIMLICAMVPLALGIALDFYIVLAKVLESTTLAAGLAAASLVFFYGLWFGLTLVTRARTAHQPGVMRVKRAA